LEIDNVIFFCSAITKPDIVKTQKEITFNYFPKNDGLSGIKRRPEEKTQEKIITVPIDTLDNIINTIKPDERTNIPFIKIDVEGGEFDVLLGAEKIMKKYKPVITIENGRQYSANLYNYTKKDFFDYFNSLGYCLFQYTGEIFTESDWSKESVYWETWLVHNNSEYLQFFKDHYMSFATIFMNDRNRRCQSCVFRN